MTKRASALIHLLAICALFLGLQHPAARFTRPNLYRIAKEPGIDQRLLESTGTVVRQELQHSLIAEATAEAAREWDRFGISFSILDEQSELKEYFLVYVRDFRTHLDLVASLRLIQVEESIFLYSGDPQQLEAALTFPFSLKALPDRIRFPAKEGKAAPVKPAAIPSWKMQAAEDITAMVQKVSRPNITRLIQALQDFKTRRTETADCQAAGDYILNYFSGLGIQAETAPFTFRRSYSTRNIIATIPGKTTPKNMVILCAHYDSTSNQSYTLAPGADDNASGTAAVMEAARIFNEFSFNSSLRFILFSAEEQGLYGSADYARKAAQAGEEIGAVINLDMIAYTDILPEDLDLITNSASEWLAERFISASQRYAAMPIKKIVDSSLDWSDHSSFWDQGYSALCGIEDHDTPNPHYHTTHDTIDTLNLEFTEAVTKATLAAAADLAQPLIYPRPPVDLAAHSQINSSLFSSVKTVYLGWQASPDHVKGYNIYRSTNRSQGFLKINASLLTGFTFVDRFLQPQTTYYYKATAINDQDQESNFTPEVKDNANN